MSFRDFFEAYITFSQSITQNGITVYKNVELKINLVDLKAGEKFDEVIIDHLLKLEKGWQRVRFVRHLDLDLKFISKSDA